MSAAENEEADPTGSVVAGEASDEQLVPEVSGTGSVVTFRLGIAAVFLMAATLVFALVLSPPELSQRDAARLLYVHLPTIAVMYLAFTITLVGSIIYLRKGSVFWDLLAGASAEIGVLFCAFVLATGAIWGKPTWGVYWQWDPRLTSTTVLFVMYLGYLAVRRLELPPDVRSRRAAILGIISFLNVFIVHYSVQWWRGLHQGQTIGVDTQLDGLMLFTLFLATVSFLVLFAWMLIHRFRLAWLSTEVDRLGLDRALAERRAESGSGFAPGAA
ncbi:MAG: cytochrome c biogenesis protein CcsA [Acidimicrobiales bacterium]